MTFNVIAGLGRLAQFPEQFTVEAKSPDEAASKAHRHYRALITEKLKGTEDEGMLNKVVVFEALEVVTNG